MVPHADGRENPGSVGHVTFLFDQRGTSVGDNHALATAYLPAAHELDRSTHVSVHSWIDSAAPFLAGPGERVSATTTVYTVTNNEERGAGSGR